MVSVYTVSVNNGAMQQCQKKPIRPFQDEYIFSLIVDVQSTEVHTYII